MLLPPPRDISSSHCCYYYEEVIVVQNKRERRARRGNGAVEAWTDEVVDRVGGASQGCVCHHMSSKLNRTDRCFFSGVNRESWGVLEYAGVDVSKLGWAVYECSSISTLEWAWNHMPWGKKDDEGNVMDQAWFCSEVAGTNKLELLKWAREVKQCEWDEETINVAAAKGNLEMLKYCFSNGCPCDEEKSCKQAAIGGHLDCLRFLFDKVKPSRDTEKEAAIQAACGGHIDILKYFVEERKISDELKITLLGAAAKYGRLDCLQYLVEEAKVPLNFWHIHRFRSLQRATRERELLARKRVPRTNGRTVRLFCRERRKR